MAAGALTVTGFAPFGLFPIPLLTLALLFLLWRDASPVEALRLGWLFGLGLFGIGVSWLHISIDQFGNVGTPFAILVTLAFIAFVALLPGLAGWAGARFGGSPGLRLGLVFPAVWVLFEWIRGWLLTGFPWLTLGYSQIDSPLAAVAPLLGVYGVSWLLALGAGVLAWLWLRPARWPYAATALIAIGLLAGLPRLVPWTQPLGEPLRVALVQPSIPQELKWELSMRLPTLEKYQRMSEPHLDRDLLIWPETAVPDFLHRVEETWLQPLAGRAKERGGRLLVGVPVLDLDSGRYYNAVTLLGASGETYHKRHLVPFGEYLPFKTLLGPLLDFIQIPMADFSQGDAAKPLVRIGDYSAGVSICYEDAFGAEVIQALPEANYLVNLSNDAWFGDSLAPHQHLEMARMRALEAGRPLLRATNSGISALVDAQGRVLAASDAFEAAVLTGEIQPRTGMTPFARVGNLALLGLVLLSLGAAAYYGGLGWPRSPLRDG